MFREETYFEAGGVLDNVSAGFVMDEAAFRAFYERNARGVWAYLARVTNDRALADDLLQEAFYRFLRASAVYESETHSRNSLYRIATNLARDARRRSALRATTASAGDAIELAPAASSGVEAQTDLNRALERLKPRERAMLWLAYAEGASHVEIAGALGLSPASLKPLLFRARRKLAGLLGRDVDGRKK